MTTLAVYLPINSDKIPFNGSITAITPIKTERKLYNVISFIFHICNDCIMLKLCITMTYVIVEEKILITMGMSCKGGDYEESM